VRKKKEETYVNINSLKYGLRVMIVMMELGVACMEVGVACNHAFYRLE
jgi:hypothetical protein